jgi:hypothetical protein
MKLQLKVKHFIDTNFEDHKNCAISKAAREQFNVPKAIEALSILSIVEDVFYHESYFITDFNNDKSIALQCIDPETVIREIELTPA